MAAVAGLYGFGDDSRTVAARFVERQRLANRDSPTDTYVHHIECHPRKIRPRAIVPLVRQLLGVITVVPFQR